MPGAWSGEVSPLLPRKKATAAAIDKPSTRPMKMPSNVLPRPACLARGTLRECRIGCLRSIGTLLHPLRSAHAEYAQAVAHDLARCYDQCETCTAQNGIVDQKLFRIIVAVKLRCQFLQVERDQMRRKFARCDRELVGKIRQPAQQRLFVGARQRRQI